MRRRVGMLMAVVLATGLLAACGSSSSGGTTVQATLKAYLQGLANGKGSEACAQMDSQMQQRLILVGKQAKVGSTCVAVVNAIGTHVPAAQKTKADHAQIYDVKITGNTATAKIKGGTGTAHLTKTNGHWLVSGD